MRLCAQWGCQCVASVLSVSQCKAINVVPSGAAGARLGFLVWPVWPEPVHPSDLCKGLGCAK